MTDTKEFLQGLMKRYTTDNISDPIAFKAKIDEFLAMEDWEMEGYTEEEKDAQRQKSIKFEWGHNHDFGSFKVDGVLGDRHINILATFIDDFGLPRDLRHKKVLDVGAWCGGTSLLLAAMGATVWYLEEVYKYVLCTNFLIDSFEFLNPASNDGFMKDGIWKLGYRKSIYDDDFIWNDRFDYIIFPGVLYHLSDPILALRILFNALKDGGELFVETAVSSDEYNAYRDMEKDTDIQFAAGKGNNWFIPSSKTVSKMLQVVGFETNEFHIANQNNRVYTKAYRTKWVPMLKAGLSRRIR